MEKNYKDRICKLSGKAWKQYNSLQKCQCDECKKEMPKPKFVQRKFNTDLKLKNLYTIPNKSTKNKVLEKTKGLSDYKAELQIEINTIVRELDKGWNCMATDTKEAVMQAGHYFSVGSNDTIRFHLLNIWLQARTSNEDKAGDMQNFKQGIINTYGLSVMDEIEALKATKPIKLNTEEVKSKIAVCRGVIKWIRLQNRKFSLPERLELRRRFNSEIDIY